MTLKTWFTQSRVSVANRITLAKLREKYVRDVANTDVPLRKKGHSGCTWTHRELWNSSWHPFLKFTMTNGTVRQYRLMKVCLLSDTNLNWTFWNSSLSAHVCEKFWESSDSTVLCFFGCKNKLSTLWMASGGDYLWQRAHFHSASASEFSLCSSKIKKICFAYSFTFQITFSITFLCVSSDFNQFNECFLHLFTFFIAQIRFWRAYMVKCIKQYHLRLLTYSNAEIVTKLSHRNTHHWWNTARKTPEKHLGQWGSWSQVFMC